MSRINPLGLGLAIAGASAAVLSIFLPLLQATGLFAGVASNSLVQSAGGIAARVVALAIVVLALTYRYHRTRSASWGVMVVGILVIVGAIVDGQNDDLTTLYALDESGDPILSGDSVTAKLGIALYVTGVGGALAALGGLLMWRYSDIAPPKPAKPEVVLATQATLEARDRERAGQRQEKPCPDCAESVLEAAKVCKHCGFRFDAAPVA
jgi:hypothetical protein